MPGRPGTPRADGADGDDPALGGLWTRHATGVLTAEDTAAPAPSSPGLAAHRRAALPVDEAYETMAAAGFPYGPAFQGLRSAWRRGEEVFLEAALAEEQSAEADAYGLHPRCSTPACTRSAWACWTASPGSGPAPVLLARGAPVRRRRRRRPRTPGPAGTDAVTVELADAAGDPVATVESLTLRAVDLDRIGPAGTASSPLLTLDWTAVPAPTAIPEGAVSSSPRTTST
ncbi:polyketide synthase dehydratase domain-containing protein [Streptomyces sp. M19]